MGTIKDGNPTGKEGILRAASSDAARCFMFKDYYEEARFILY
jgi:hypothetical protein